MIRVDGRTQLYAVLGDPVDHSLSPRMQNAAFEAAGMNAVYVALQVPAPRLQQALDGLHAARVLGVNLTTPHKEAAFSIARERTPEAERARAVNTLRWEPEGWHGHATDGEGFLAWIEEVGIDLRGRRVRVVGAGGAAREIVPRILERAPESIGIVSRSEEHARALERLVAPFAGAALVRAGQDGSPWDVLVRAVASEEVSAEEERWWRGGTKEGAVLDLNYGARAALARLLAHRMNLRYEDGSALLIHQGAASFTFWTGQPAPVESMREALA
jgi:shikimate dehydrogenase